jgi:hypothetical protein
MEDNVRYPIGRFEYQKPTALLLYECIAQFRNAPDLLRRSVDGLHREQLESVYRPGGWTIAQVVHHLAEADVNAYPRMKYALTEDTPTVLVAQEALWAELADARSPIIDGSLFLFEAIRRRWADAWESLSEADFGRKWKHAHFGTVPLDHILQQYAWHGRHHVAQIINHRRRMGW